VRDQDFERLYAEHAQRLFSFLVYRTGDRALAEDVLADTFERVLRGRARFDRRRGSEKTWLYSIALNRVRDEGRRTAAEGRALERMEAGRDLPGHDHGVAVIEARMTVERALELLNADEREAIALRYGADLTLPEIAALTDLPLTTMEGRVYRALQKLRNALA
jgi:RNA polymerase sigma factor (sigma-70 family)